MKRIFLTLLCALAIAGAQAQVQAKAEGNNLIQTPVIKTEAEIIGKAKPTGQTFLASNGEEYPVYKLADSKPFIARKSKGTGGYYKQTIDVK